MAYEKIVSVPSTATSGQVPQADGAGGFDWGTVDAYTKEQTLTEATKTAYGLDASAVPDDVFNAVKGLLGGGAKIATGSYVGTGTYGANNPCSLTFDKIPDIFIIMGGGNTPCPVNLGTGSSNGLTYPKLINTYPESYSGWRQGGYSIYAQSGFQSYIKMDGNTLSWYSKLDGSEQATVTAQFNTAGKTYYYLTITIG